MGEFKIGDEVCVVRVSSDWENYVSELDEYIGCIGTVCMAYYHAYEPASYRIDFGDGKHRWVFSGEFLELVEKLDPGDLPVLFKYKDGSI